MRAEDQTASGAGPHGFEPLNVTVYGVDRIALVTAAGLAALGHSVLCMDGDIGRVAQMARGDLPFHEPHLPELIVRHGLTGRLRFTANVDEAVAYGRLQFIAVNTVGGEDGAADLRRLAAVARHIGDGMAQELLVVVRSSVPVGTGERVREAIGASLARRGRRVPFAIASNPDFLREGSAVDDFMQPDRIVVGTDARGALSWMKRLYQPLLQPPVQWLPMSLRAAEFTQYACNTMLAARISLMNDLATLAEALRVDIGDVQRGLASDPRIGPHFLEPGCGFGGTCLPRGLRAMRRSAADAGVQLPMLDAAELVNERQKTLLPWHIIQAFDGHLAGRRIALWGLAFKPDTDELRDAPSESVIQALLAEGAEVVAYDPLAMPAARARYADLPRLRFAADPFGAVVGADALAIVTDWPEFRQIDWRKVRRCMDGLRVFDGRNVCPVDELVELGFSYRGVGRAVHEAPAEAMAPAH
jgi:UDPglucose 6-dehydrogenase